MSRQAGQKHSGHYSLKNLPRVTEKWVYRLCVLPTDAGWCQNPFPDVLNTLWLLVLLTLRVSALFTWLIPAQADPSSLVLVTISWECRLYYTLPESPKNSSSPALPRQGIESAKETGKKKKKKKKRLRGNTMSTLPRQQKENKLGKEHTGSHLLPRLGWYPLAVA